MDCVGHSDGLTLLWMNDIDLEIQSYSANHIDAFVKRGLVVFLVGGSITGFYGFPVLIIELYLGIFFVDFLLPLIFPGSSLETFMKF